VGPCRVGLKDEWLEADKQYAASLAPAQPDGELAASFQESPPKRAALLHGV
jgi:hypothetical protein